MKKEAFGLFFIVCYLLDSALRQTQRLSIQRITLPATTSEPPIRRNYSGG